MSQTLNTRTLQDDGALLSRGTHRSLERGLTILEHVATAAAPVSLATLARHTGLHRSTAHHLLQALVQAGFLSQDAASRAYVPSSRLYRMTGVRWTSERLGDLARPHLETLTRETGEGSSLAVWAAGRVRIACKQETDGPVRVVQDVEADRPLHCTAVGKALAAWLPRGEVLAALARAPMTRMTPKTLTTVAAFEAELRRIRTAGYAIDDEEQYVGLRCVAMPVFDHDDSIVASMCVLGPRHRMTNQRLQAVRSRLAERARALSGLLGQASVSRTGR